MKWLLVLPLALAALLPQDSTPSRFLAVDVYVDSGAEPLAAWQLELRATAGTVRIAGVEGGAEGVFADPPYYDPKAMRQERVVLAAFSTAAASTLPKGRTRVARVHVQVSGEAKLALRLDAAANAAGQRIQAEANQEPARK